MSSECEEDADEQKAQNADRERHVGDGKERRLLEWR